jgi:positive regulator of sigma E activity
MPDQGNSEFYFIGAMMLLIVILCTVATFVFVRTYKKEMRERAERLERKHENAPEDTRQE